MSIGGLEGEKMITTVENLTIDVYGTQKRTVVFAKQADGGTRRLCVRITEHGTTLAASPEDTAVFGVCRADGEAKAYFATVNEDGTVSSVSRYNDFRQYNGSTPKEVALAMLRIRAKYRYMGPVQN